MTGPAMLSRSAGTLKSMMLLMPERHLVDALVLLRALYESVVVFSWMAAQAPERPERWVAWCREDALHVHNDWNQGGRPVLSPATIAEYQDYIRDVRERSGLARQDERGKYTDALVPGVDVMATDCDRWWGQIVAGWSADSYVGDLGQITGWHSSLRGLYRWIYRIGSSVTHAGHRSLEPFITSDASRLLVHDENRAENLVPYGLGCYLLGLQIGVAEQVFGWPDYRRAARILGVYDSLFRQS